MTQLQKFVGGSLDGQELEITIGVYTHRVPKPFIPSVASDVDLYGNFDVETYIFDHALGKFVEESMASDGAIQWQTFELEATIGEMLTDGNSDILEMGKRHYNQVFDAKICAEIIRMAQKVGLKLQAVKYLLDKNEELASENRRLTKENERLDKQNQHIKIELLGDLCKVLDVPFMKAPL